MIPLPMASANENLIIKEIRGGGKSRKRLADLGISVGIEIQIVSSQLQGPMIVLVKGSRLVLGRGMAQKILVQPGTNP